MSGHHKWADIRARRDSPEVRALVEEERRLTQALMTLAELRERQGMTQDEVARALEVSQANVSKIERRDDIYLTTLRRYVEALGGTVRVSAVFDGEEVPLAVLGRDEAAAHAGR